MPTDQMDRRVKQLALNLKLLLAEFRNSLEGLDGIDREMAINDVAELHLAFGDFILSLPELQEFRARDL